MSTHAEQVASVLQRAIQTVITRGLADPRISGLISITKVKVSPDLAEATVMVSVLPAERQRATMSGLRHAAPRIRREVGRSVSLRRLPRLVFKVDESLKTQARIHAAINEAVGEQKTDEQVMRPTPPETPDHEDSRP